MRCRPDPALPNLPATAAETALSISAPGSTMNGSDPPSSSTAFLKCRPASSPTALPARSEPVSETPCSSGLAIIVATWSVVANTFW